MERPDTDRQEIDRLVDARTKELTAFSQNLIDLSERLRSDTARTLHDELGGLLTAAKMDLSWLQSRVDAPGVTERLAQLGSVLDEAMDLKRRVVEDLRPSLLEHFGLVTALRSYVESTCSKAGLECELKVIYEGDSMSRATAIAMFRVVEAALSNIVRHASCKLVQLTLDGDAETFVFTLTDDGRGFDPASLPSGHTYGLMGMRQRVSALGGRMELRSRLGGGTTVSARIPVAAAA